MNIFIIEDDVRLREELAMLLEKYGYTCQSSDDFPNISSLPFPQALNLVLLDPESALSGWLSGMPRDPAASRRFL